MTDEEHLLDVLSKIIEEADIVSVSLEGVGPMEGWVLVVEGRISLTGTEASIVERRLVERRP